MPTPIAKTAVARYHTSSERLRRIAWAADAGRFRDRGTAARGAKMSRARRFAADADRLENNRATAAAKADRAPRFAAGGTRRAEDPGDSGPLLRMIPAQDSAFLAVSRAADLVQRRLVRAPRFAGGAARRAADPTA